MLACTKMDKHDKLATVRLLLDNGAIVDYRNKDGWTAVHIACREGDPAVLRLLLNHNADVSKRTNNGRSGLHVAALHGNTEIAQHLLRVGEYGNNSVLCSLFHPNECNKNTSQYFIKKQCFCVPTFV